MRLKTMFHELASANGAEFFVRYGQTKAYPIIPTLTHGFLK